MDQNATMQATGLPTTLIALAFTSCANVPETGLAPCQPPLQNVASRPVSPAISMVDALHLDMVQRTCALYVAVRSSAFEAPLAFGLEVDDSMVHWNLCPGGTMVACAKVPTSDGDSMIVGIPWPYGTSVEL